MFIDEDSDWERDHIRIGYERLGRTAARVWLILKTRAEKNNNMQSMSLLKCFGALTLNDKTVRPLGAHLIQTKYFVFGWSGAYNGCPDLLSYQIQLKMSKIILNCC